MTTPFLKNEAHFARLSPSLNSVPPDIRHIHLMGICGTAMAALAGILKRKGYHVTGSDRDIYPPMSYFLRDLSIPVMEGYRPENLSSGPDLVIVGNVITGQNPEAVALAGLEIPYLSLPQALRHFAMKGKRSIVISGTHGKTTTSSLISWVLEKAGMDPGFMIGGIPRNFSSGFKLGEGPYFVIEGDEYDTAFFDKGPKFLHYAPWIAILTGIEFDHADIFRDLDHVIEAFRSLIDLIPADGLLISNRDDPLLAAESKRAKCPVFTYGLDEHPIRPAMEMAHWGAAEISMQDDRTCLKILKNGKEYIRTSTPLYGRHNISNLLSTAALSEYLGIDPHILSEALGGFRGVKRRQEIRGEKRGILVLDDFAHHPTAVRKTIEAVRERYRGRRLLAVFEPRSNSSRRNVFQKEYASAFDLADLILLPEPPLMEKIPPQERFSSRKLVDDLNNRGRRALYCPDTDRLLDEILTQGRKGDVVLIMSNGSFDNLIERLLKRLDNSCSSVV